jgi:putative transposase
VVDITYSDTVDGSAYLHLITDAYSKRIMGYELCSNMEAASTLKALAMAIENRQYKGQFTQIADSSIAVRFIPIP